VYADDSYDKACIIHVIFISGKSIQNSFLVQITLFLGENLISVKLLVLYV
jgi:hypothetical protein